jgi:protein-tyrosine phosphatase
VIDFHCHILPNIDDGPIHIDESVAMARALHQAGFRQVFCTPHQIRGSYEVDNQTVRSAVSVLQSRLDDDGIDIQLFSGREYYLDEFLDRYLKNPLFLEGTQFILLEIPNHASVEFVKEACFRIKCSGFIPMIAHPERCSLFAENLQNESLISRLLRLKMKSLDQEEKQSSLLNYLKKDIGCAFQGNLGSFGNRHSPEVHQAADYLKKKGVYTHFGTDAHSLRGIKFLTDQALIPSVHLNT